MVAMAHLLIYGGTFDPIHHGHLITCRRAREILKADVVLLVPARISPHKVHVNPADVVASATPAQRLEMIQRAIANEPGFQADARELQREGPSYTIDTLLELHQEHQPSGRLTLLLGADQLSKLHTWYRIQEILGLCEIGILPRPRIDVAAGMRAIHEALGEPLSSRIHSLDTPLIDISATDIRARARAGLPVSYLVPEAVAQYIREHKTYHYDALV
jgi:nicotinate-nucleotide adenylyltransferase